MTKLFFFKITEKTVNYESSAKNRREPFKASVWYINKMFTTHIKRDHRFHRFKPLLSEFFRLERQEKVVQKHCARKVFFFFKIAGKPL